MKGNQTTDMSSNNTPDEFTSRLGFLDSIAMAYARTFDDLSDFCFVFPNKRAGTFFLRGLDRQLGKNDYMLAPEVTSVSDFVSTLSGMQPDSRIDMLFRLYNIYCGMRGVDPNAEGDEQVVDFDSFRGWGETLISDFSETDQYYADASALYKNVKDLREISANFLTEEQIEIMERFFGYTPRQGDVTGFWNKLVPPEERSELKNKFVALWEQMYPLYERLNESLEKDGLCTPGRCFRMALDRLRESGKSLLPWKKVVMVGFNALSTTEALIFEELKKLEAEPGIEGDFAEFYWDGTGPVLNGELNDAATFLKYNRRNFPSPEWAAPFIALNETERMPPEIKVIAAPSNSAQAKLAADRVEEILLQSGDDKMKDAGVAVVLPDEGLLMPLLYALPEKLKAVNLTMGYPFRLTSVVSFVHHLRRVHMRSRPMGGQTAYYHEDLRELFAHPYIHMLAGSDKVSKINGYITERHLMMVKEEDIAQLSPELGYVLRTLAPDSPTSASVAYIDDVLSRVDASFTSEREGLMKSRIDRTHIALYRDALRRLDSSASEHGIKMSLRGVFAMVDKLIAGEQVQFEGEPLEGLQVMGLLETRSLDFESLVILSLNDKVMPRKASRKSFIPDSLRRGYGLPYANYREDLFSYYFYRMISRARSVTLLYDARAGEGMRSGGMSRYLHQLRHLYGGNGLSFETTRYMLSDTSRMPQAVQKDSYVMGKLEEFAQKGSGRNFSASSLKKYLQCPVRFYYEVVERISAENEPTPYISAVTQGNVVHEVMLKLYVPKDLRKKYIEEGIEITENMIDGLLKDEDKIEQYVKRAINRLHFGYNSKEDLEREITGAAAIVKGYLAKGVESILQYDRGLAPFRLMGAEIDGLTDWKVGERFVNMKYAIDRLDKISGEDGGHYRIVDYKTGNADVKASRFENIFDGTEDAKNIFQLLLYANLMNRDRSATHDVGVEIYEVSSILKGGKKPEIEGRKIDHHGEVNEKFVKRLDEILGEIYDPDKPFIPVNDDDRCKYCNLGHLCGRG